MDNIQSLLLMKNDITINFLILIIILPIINKLLANYIYELQIEKYIYKLLYGEWNTIEIIGFDSIKDSIHCIDYPKSFIAISYYAYKNKKCNKLKYIILAANNNRNIFYNISAEDQNDTNYIIDYCNNVEIEDDIFIDLIEYTDKFNGEQFNGNSFSKLKLIVKSKKVNMDGIRNFVDKCINEYEKNIKRINENKIFHFIYNGRDEERKRLLFSQQIISDYGDSTNINYETFDNLFHDHKEKIISDIDRLNDLAYFKKHGIKRKKGYLFYGNPGCGKTSTVMAIANYTKRHIIEISMSRVKTNLELQEIMCIDEINKIKFDKEQIILLFDEIDHGIMSENNMQIEKETYNFVENKLETFISKNKSDELSLGTILSRFDGIGSYSGLIIIATTNNINKLPDSLYRCGRLDPLYFDFANKMDIIKMIEKYYEIDLTEKQKNRIPEDGYKKSHAMIKFTMELYNNVDLLLMDLLLNNSN